MNIRELRQSKNLSQKELALIVGVKRSTVSMWENNKATPTVETLKKLSEVFNCKVDDLL